MMKPSTQKRRKKFLIGTIVNKKSLKTLTVRVNSTKTHPRYQKIYKTSRKYLCHNPKNEYQIGDRVTICECRPASRRKHWMVVKKFNSTINKTL